MSRDNEVICSQIRGRLAENEVSHPQLLGNGSYTKKRKRQISNWSQLLILYPDPPYLQILKNSLCT